MRVNESQLLTVLKNLIKIESINPTLAKEGSGEAAIAYYIGDYLKDLGLDVKFQKIAENRPNTIGILKGKGNGRSLLLNGHTDTVSVSSMKIEPFNPLFKAGKVYGRGASDMKCGLAMMIMAAQTIFQNDLELKGNLLMAYVADEEYASLGTEELVKEYTAEGGIVCEPSNMNIIIAHKGFAWIKVNVHGKSAHGSLKDFGVDAIVKAGKFLAKIEELEQLSLSQKKHELLGSPSIHASLINGGIELSTYPDECKIELERRNLPGETPKIISNEIQSLIDNIHENDDKFQAEQEIFFYRSPLEISKDEKIVKSLEKSCRELDIKPSYGGFAGWTDAALMNDAGTPTVIFGPKGTGNHGDIEFVNFKSVIKSTEILINTIIDFCNH